MAALPVFISYSHDDESWRNRLVAQLKVLEREGFVEIWDQGRIAAGSHRPSEIEAAINGAQVAVLLISNSYLISELICEQEIPLLRQRYQEGLRVIPLIIKPCAWESVGWLKELNKEMPCRTANGRALSQAPKHQAEAALVALAEEIRDPESLRAGNGPRPISAASGQRRRRLQGPLLLSGLLTVAVAAVIISRLLPTSNHNPTPDHRQAAPTPAPTPVPLQVRTPEYQEQLTLGLEALRRHEGARAEQLLAQALDEGDFPEAHAARAAAFTLLGKDTEAIAEATRAKEGIKTLPERDTTRLRVQAQVDLTLGNWKAARREYEGLRQSSSPPDADIIVGLAEATLESRRELAALSFVKEMQDIPDPRLDLVAARAAALLGHFEDVKKAASQALERSKDKPILTAEALLFRGVAYSGLGKAGEARKDLTKALESARQNPDLVADIQDTLGAVEFSVKNYRRARVYYEHARRVFTQRGNSDRVGNVNLNLATIYMETGELSAARKVFAALLSNVNPGEEGKLRGNLGLVLLRQGNLAAASEQLERAYQLASTGGNSPAKARAACNFALFQGTQLSHDSAVSLLTECREEAAGDPSTEAMALAVQGQLLLLQGRDGASPQSLRGRLGATRPPRRSGQDHRKPPLPRRGPLGDRASGRGTATRR